MTSVVERLLLAVALLAGSPARSLAEDADPQHLPPAFERGLAAARQQQWDAAIDAFAEARKGAREEPRILFNLGLAHAKAGHELAASAWLRAYLVSHPDAANAGSVEKQIDAMEAQAAQKIERCFQAAIKATEPLSEPARNSALFVVAVARAAGADLNGAFDVLRLRSTTNYQEYDVIRSIYLDALTEILDMENSIYKNTKNLHEKDFEIVISILNEIETNPRELAEWVVNDLDDAIGRLAEALAKIGKPDAGEQLASRLIGEKAQVELLAKFKSHDSLRRWQLDNEAGNAPLWIWVGLAEGASRTILEKELKEASLVDDVAQVPTKIGTACANAGKRLFNIRGYEHAASLRASEPKPGASDLILGIDQDKWIQAIRSGQVNTAWEDVVADAAARGELSQTEAATLRAAPQCDKQHDCFSTFADDKGHIVLATLFLIEKPKAKYPGTGPLLHSYRFAYLEEGDTLHGAMRRLLAALPRSEVLE